MTSGGFDPDEDVPETIEIVVDDVTIKLDTWLSGHASCAVAVMDKVTNLLEQKSNGTVTHMFDGHEHTFVWQAELQHDQSITIRLSHEEKVAAE